MILYIYYMMIIIVVVVSNKKKNTISISVIVIARRPVGANDQRGAKKLKSWSSHYRQGGVELDHPENPLKVDCTVVYVGSMTVERHNTSSESGSSNTEGHGAPDDTSGEIESRIREICACRN